MTTFHTTKTGKPSHFRRGILCAVAMLLSLSLAACGAAPSPSAGTGSSTLATANAGFDSPEDATKAYLEALRDSDLDRMMSTFAIDIYVQNYDFEANLERVSSYGLTQEIKLPNTNEFVTALNTETRRSAVSTAISRQYITLCAPQLDQTQPQILKEEGQVNQLVSQLEKDIHALPLSTLKVVGFVPPEALSDLYLLENNQNNMAKRAAIYGADQLVSCAAVFSLNGAEYLLCVDTAQYGNRWYLQDLGGNIGGLMSLAFFTGGVIPLDLYEEGDVHQWIVPVA